MAKFIAFDLDGVFVPDLEYPVYSDGAFLDTWGRIRPLFVPQIPIYIISMRKETIRDFTMKWLKDYNFNVIRAYFMAGNHEDFSPMNCAVQKLKAIADLIEKEEISCYVESSKEQVDIMKQEVAYNKELYKGIPVIHFEQFLREKINLLSML